MAQTYPPIVQGSKLYEFKNGARIDSGLFLPRRDTSITDATMKAPGMILYRTADSLLYYMKGNTMVALTTGSGAYVRYSDTASMLAPYLRIIDTTAMLSPYLRIVDTAGLLRTIPSLQQVTDTGNTTTNTISITGSNNAPSPAQGLQLSYNSGGRIESANPSTGDPTPLTIAASTVFMDDAVIGPLTTTGNAKFTGNGTPGAGKIPAGTDGTGNWVWNGGYWDSTTTKTKLATQGQVVVNVNNLSYVPGYTQTTNKSAGNTSLTNQYGSSSGIGGFYTNINGSTDYPDSAGTGMIVQRASTATSVSSRGSMQLWTSASKGVDSSLFFRKTDVNALTGNVWLPWRKIVDDFNFKKVATASGFWDTTATKLKLSRFAPAFLRVKKLNDTVYVRSIYNDSTDMVQLMVLHNANNQAALLGTYLIKSTDSTLYYRISSTTINTGTDNTAPLQYVYLGSISGAHGVQAITATIAGHDKTSADIGSIWTDGTYQYYLAEITDANNIVFMSLPYTVSGEQGIRQNAFAASTLTHVSGATHTGSMVSTNEDPLQRYPVTFNNLQKLIVDDRVITADSEYYCNSFQIVDRYDVVDPTTYTATNPFVWNAGSSLARVDMAYRWGRNGAIVMGYGIKFNTSHKTINSGLIQVQKLPVGGTFAKLFDYIPGTKPKTVGATTYNFAAKQDMTSNPAANFYLVKTDMLDSTKPVNRMVQLLTNSSNISLSNSAHGYDITYGSGLPDNRRINNDTAIWYITTANKSYPRLQSGINSLNKTIYSSAYFTFFDPKKNDSLTACYAIPSADAWLLYIDAHQQLTRYTVKVDQFLAGKRIEVVEKNDSMTLVTTDAVPAGGLIINNTNGNGYLVLRLTDQSVGGAENGLYKLGNNVRLGTNQLIEDVNIPLNAHNFSITGNGTPVGTGSNPTYDFRHEHNQAGDVGMYTKNANKSGSTAYALIGDSVGVSGTLVLVGRTYNPTLANAYAQPSTMQLASGSIIKQLSLRTINPRGAIRFLIDTANIAAWDSSTIVPGNKALHFFPKRAGEKNIEITNFGNNSAPGSDLHTVPTGITRSNWSLILSHNMVVDTGALKWNNYLINRPTCAMEAGFEGITLSAGAPGTNYSDQLVEGLQVRGNGVDANATLNTGKWIQTKFPIYSRYSSTPFATVGNNGSWEAGDTRPQIWLHSEEDKGSDGEFFRLEQNSSTTEAPHIYFKKSRGTYASKTVGSSGDYTGILDFANWDGTNYITGARIRSELEGTPTTNNAPAGLVFGTGVNGTTDWMHITNAGAVNITGANALGIGVDAAVNYTTVLHRIKGSPAHNRVVRFDCSSSDVNGGWEYWNSSTSSSLLFLRQDGLFGIGNAAPSSKLTVNGSVAAAITSISANTTLTSAHYTIRATTSGITVTFPTASSCPGRIYCIINYNTGGTITTSAFLSPSAVSTTTIANQTTVWVQSDGSNWYQIK